MSILDRTDYRAMIRRALEAVMDDEDIGICVYCGVESVEHVEPDARKQRCASCGLNGVYGAQSIIELGMRKG